MNEFSLSYDRYIVIEGSNPSRFKLKPTTKIIGNNGYPINKLPN